MSEMSKKARSAGRAKANRLAGNTDPHRKVDASSWEPNEPLNADRKTGARPIRARIYKAGGRIQGDRGPRRADKTPRAGKAGGGALTVHDTAKENKEKLGSYHVGGYKKGGKARRHRDMGGMADPREAAAANMAAGAARSGVPQGRFQVASSGKSPYLRDGGSAKAKRFCDGGMAKGGRPTQPGGKPHTGNVNQRGDGTSLRRMDAIDQDEKVKHKRSKRAEGGKLSGLPGWGQKSLKSYEPDSPENKQLKAQKDAAPKATKDAKYWVENGKERPERKAGGRAKGKTNINIIIGRGGGDQPQMPPQGVVRPPTPPPPMSSPGMPPGGPPPGLGAAGGPPPGMPPGGPPGMPRKRGGRTYRDMEAGAGSGMGRLEKTDIQKHMR